MKRVFGDKKLAPEARLEDVIEHLRLAGYRLTAQRIAICRALVESDNHPTAGDLFERVSIQFPTMSLTTVYSTLAVLRDLGQIYELGAAGDERTHYEVNLHPHLNLICLSCHRIVDFDAATLAPVEAQVMAQSGYRIKGARLVYYGICPACEKEEDEARNDA